MLLRQLQKFRHSQASFVVVGHSASADILVEGNGINKCISTCVICESLQTHSHEHGLSINGRRFAMNTVFVECEVYNCATRRFEYIWTTLLAS